MNSLTVVIALSLSAFAADATGELENELASLPGGQAVWGRSIVKRRQRGARRQLVGRTDLVIRYSTSMNRIRSDTTVFVRNAVRPKTVGPQYITGINRHR